MVGDDMFATESDSVSVGRQGTATRENGRRPGSPSGSLPGSSTGSASGRVGDVSGGAEEVGLDVLRRLRDRVDRNVRLVDRMRADPLAPEPPGLPDLIDTARRLRHDAETLLLLAGLDAGARPGAPARLSTLLDEAVDATEEPMRVDVRSGPAVTVEPVAATELLHVVAEVVDHVTAIHPGGRIEVAWRTESSGGIVVEVRTASTTRYDPSGRRGMAAAARMAARSVSGLVLHNPPPGPAGAGVPIAAVHCPARSVHVQEPDYRPVSLGGLGGLGGLDTHAEPWLPTASAPPAPLAPPPLAPPPLAPPSPAPTSTANGYDRVEPETPIRGLLPVDPLPSRRPAPRRSVDPSPRERQADAFADPFREPFAEPFAERFSGPFSPPPPPPPRRQARVDTDPFLSRRDTPSGGSTNGFAHRSSNGRDPHGHGSVDELFGPLVELPAESDGYPMTTPIFEAVASAWFHHDTATAGATDWESPNDREWRAAAERAAAPDPATSFTAEGLPRRRPGGRLVAPRVRDGGGTHAGPQVPTDRVPDRIRERLATYQRGLRQGRHRAEPNDSGDSAAW